MEDSKVQFENLVSEIDKLEDKLDGVQTQLETVVEKIVTLMDSLRERDEKKLRYEVEDLEKEEVELEELLYKKRLDLVKARQQLRSKLIERTEVKEQQQKKKMILSALASSSMFLSSKRSNAPNAPTISPRGSEIRTSSNHELLNGDSNANRDDDFLISQWLVSPKELEYDRKNKLGSGAFGDVYKGKLRGKEVAIKKLSFQQFDEDTLSEFKKEVAVMAKLRHPNVLLFMGACTSPGNLAMVTELMPKGSVYDLFQNKENKISIQTRMTFAKDTAMGMNWLHCSNPLILHLDLKTQNLLVDENWNVKVADFGLSRMKSASISKGKAGSPIYMAPEMLLDLGYDEKADVYSFGIVLWELFTQEEPYKDQFKNFDDLVEAITKKGKRPEIPDTCSAKLKSLIQSCWNPSPANRPSFSQILKSNVFDEVIVESLISERNELGRSIWKENFLEKSHVPWSDFLRVFYKSLGVTLPNDPEDVFVQCLHILLAKHTNNNNETVSMEDFGRMLEWFGPLEKGNGILKRIEAQLRLKGFFGEIETQDAEKMLNGKKKGTYLIRFSTRDPGCYAITVLSKLSVLKHYRIYHKAGLQYLLGNQEFPSLEALIKAHKKELYLKHAHTGSKYETMFTACDKRTATQGYMDHN